MKVTGITKICYVVEMTPEELSLLHNDQFDHCGPTTQKIGQDYEIYSAWQSLRKLQKDTGELARMSGKLRLVADLLEPIACEVVDAT